MRNGKTMGGTMIRLHTFYIRILYITKNCGESRRKSEGGNAIWKEW